MFYDTEITILANQDEASAMKTISGDVQPYTKLISFEDGYQIPITKRAFCDKDAAIDLNNYSLYEQTQISVFLLFS